MSSQQSPANLQSSVDREKIYQWIVELSNPETRENALQELRCFEFTVTVTGVLF
jgi:CCR4-NOT transcription complex subunit 9